MDDPTNELDEFLGLIRDSRVTTYAVLASLALLLFDYFLTIEQEIAFVWKSQFRWGKVLFLIVCLPSLLFIRVVILEISYVISALSPMLSTRQYISTILRVQNCMFDNAIDFRRSDNTNMTSCLTALRFQTASSNVVLWLVELSLATRVWLLYSRSKIVLFGLLTLYICSMTTVTVISVTALFHKGAVLPRPGPFLSGCYTNIPSYYSYVVLLPIVTTTVLLLLTVYKTTHAMAIAGYQKPAMISLLLRDGVLYFSSVIVVLVINLLLFKFARPTMASVASGFLVAVPYVAGSRSFLNVREKLQHPNVSIVETLSTFELRVPDAVLSERFEMGVLESNDYQSVQMSVTDVERDSAATLVPSESAPWA